MYQKKNPSVAMASGVVLGGELRHMGKMKDV